MRWKFWYVLLAVVVLTLNSINLSGQAEKASSLTQAIHKKTGIATNKVEQAIQIFNRYTNLIENLKNKETLALKDRRKQINTLKQALKVELETVLSADELPKFQKELSIEKQKNKALLTDDERKAMYAEVQNLLKETYFPVVKEERLALEKQLDQNTRLKIKSYKSDLMKRQNILKEKQESCNTAKKFEKRKCLKAIKTLKTENQDKTKIYKDWLLSNETFSHAFNNINQQKEAWQTAINKILTKYYVDIDTADFPVKANYFLKQSAALNFAFLDAEKLAWIDEDFSTYGKIDFTYYMNGQPWVVYHINNAVNVTIQVVSSHSILEQNINEARLEANSYKNDLSTSLTSGLYLVRLLLNGTLADVKRLAIP